MDQPVRYFQPRLRAFGVVAFGIVLVGAIAGLVPLLGQPDPVQMVLSSMTAPVAVWGIWRVWRQSITVTADGVVVRNQLRDHHLRWSEITGAEYRMFPRFYQPGGVFLLLEDGREVRCHAFGDGPLDDMRATQHVLQALNARVVTTP
ncbi:PH domain-containing protein [Lentzea tibetensis]|uniref:PH domain-containing protein n=1 Tax=Lentzea tibetensis TaxID=2591470 RepID=A0A563EZD0_9PSEU|nr:PH domain-containing protein [Lentzea tibetensis]TWP52983.1 PH domain-containing protein [Lentzea tibetensis]